MSECRYIHMSEFVGTSTCMSECRYIHMSECRYIHNERLSLHVVLFHDTCYTLANVATCYLAHIISAQIIVLMLVAATPSCDQRLFKKFFVQKVFSQKSFFCWKWANVATSTWANVAASKLACMVVVLTSWVPGNHHRHHIGLGSKALDGLGMTWLMRPAWLVVAH